MRICNNCKKEFSTDLEYLINHTLESRNDPKLWDKIGMGLILVCDTRSTYDTQNT